MKKHYLIISIFCLLAAYAQAQNYQCLRNDTTVYWFVNADHYLRGIRIDSVRTSGADTIYYPYHTERNGDTAAASWVGKGVIEKPDGTFLFNNAYNDTVVIKTQAALGDSWTFYNDSGNTFYTATVTSLDTMTILGSLDSIKRVTINAYNPHPDSNDQVNNFCFILSKYHCFVQLFDIYNFPYHAAEDTSVNCWDMYFHFLNKYYPDLREQIFSAVTFHIPTNLELYDYQPGDAFQWETGTEDFSACSCPVTDYYGYLYDSVIARQDIDSAHTKLVLLTRNDEYEFYCSEPDSDRHYYSPYSFIDTINIDNRPAFSMSKLPEEYTQEYLSQRKVYYYNPADTSLCFVGKSFLATTPFIFEGYISVLQQKNGLGLIDTNFGQGAACSYAIGVAAVTETKLVYARKNGVACGVCSPPLSVQKQFSEPVSVTISPNPANDELSIKIENVHNKSFTYTIVNTIGQTIQTFHSSAGTQTINVSNWPSGLYFVNISSQDGEKRISKIVVTH